MELAGKIVAVVEADLEGNFGDGIGGAAEEFGGAVDPQLDEVGDGRAAGGGLEGARINPRPD
jgi:hypothetical protein